MDVRITHLEPMHVAYVQAYGATPEADAWGALLAWAQERGLLGQRHRSRFFGYDNVPEDALGRHGYQTWVSLPSESPLTLGEHVQSRAFGGGLYAVARCRVADVVGTWTRLHAWIGGSGYVSGTHQWLEEHLTLPEPPWHDVLLDLYHPIAEPGCAGTPHQTLTDMNVVGVGQFGRHSDTDETKQEDDHNVSRMHGTTDSNTLSGCAA